MIGRFELLIRRNGAFTIIYMQAAISGGLYQPAFVKLKCANAA